MWTVLISIDAAPCLPATPPPKTSKGLLLQMARAGPAGGAGWFEGAAALIHYRTSSLLVLPFFLFLISLKDKERGKGFASPH